MKEQIEKLIEKIESKHINDPTLTDGLDEIEELLSKDLEATILTLGELNENTISWISTRFENLSWKFKSSAFIAAIEELIPKFPKTTPAAASA